MSASREALFFLFTCSFICFVLRVRSFTAILRLWLLSRVWMDELASRPPCSYTLWASTVSEWGSVVCVAWQHARKPGFNSFSSTSSNSSSSSRSTFCDEHCKSLEGFPKEWLPHSRYVHFFFSSVISFVQGLLERVSDCTGLTWGVLSGQIYEQHNWLTLIGCLPFVTKHKKKHVGSYSRHINTVTNLCHKTIFRK